MECSRRRAHDASLRQQFSNSASLFFRTDCPSTCMLPSFGPSANNSHHHKLNSKNPSPINRTVLVCVERQHRSNDDSVVQPVVSVSTLSLSLLVILGDTSSVIFPSPVETAVISFFPSSSSPPFIHYHHHDSVFHHHNTHAFLTVVVDDSMVIRAC
jgi:hypothetical protein